MPTPTVTLIHMYLYTIFTYLPNYLNHYACKSADNCPFTLQHSLLQYLIIHISSLMKWLFHVPYGRRHLLQIFQSAKTHFYILLKWEVLHISYSLAISFSAVILFLIKSSKNVSHFHLLYFFINLCASGQYIKQIHLSTRAEIWKKIRAECHTWKIC